MHRAVVLVIDDGVVDMVMPALSDPDVIERIHAIDRSVIVIAVLSAALCAKTGARFGTVGFFDGP